MDLKYGRVVVQRMYHSTRARGMHRAARQRRPIGELDLRGIHNMETFMMVWRETMGKKMYGTFSLLARGRRGRFARCLGVIVIRRGCPLQIDDNRCALYRLLKKRTERRTKEKEHDFAYGGGLS